MLNFHLLKIMSVYDLVSELVIEQQPLAQAEIVETVAVVKEPNATDKSPADATRYFALPSQTLEGEWTLEKWEFCLEIASFSRSRTCSNMVVMIEKLVVIRFSIFSRI
ncbi:hypothetical protein H0H24_10955 [Acinetobacter baumannii]|nr:hypothetical protein H0H24_10955 [Acinetobacter baumannii]